MDEAFACLEGYCTVVDDEVILTRTIEDHHAPHVRSFLQSCVEKNIILNTDKWAYARPKVEFTGFHLSDDGYRIDDSIVAAISKFPPPTNRTDLRSFVGLVNQLSASIPAMLVYWYHCDPC